MKLLEDDLFQERMQERVAEIEGIIKEFLPIELTEQKTVFAAMEYSLMAGGKRLRPMLLQESYRLFGGKEKETVHAFMAAIEMIHTYSLVHDDLPAMDNDDYRRGKETTHRVFGEDMGILTGDALLNYAYETAVLGIGKSEKKEDAVQALAILAKKGRNLWDGRRTGCGCRADREDADKGAVGFYLQAENRRPFGGGVNGWCSACRGKGR